MRKITYNRPKFLVKHQLDILNDGAQIVVVEGGTKSGKTAAMAVMMIEEALQGQPGDDCYWIAPNTEQSKIGFDYINDFIRGTALEGREPVSGNKPVIYLANGVKIRFVGNASDEKAVGRIYGNRSIFTVVDECSRCHPSLFVVVNSLITHTNGRICLIGNVISRTNWFYLLCRKIEKGEVVGSYHKITYRDAVKEGILLQSVIDRIKTLISPWEFASLYECDPIDDFKNPFGIQHIDRCTEDYDMDSIKYIDKFGVDIGRKHDRTTISGMNEDGYLGVMEVFMNHHTLQRDRIKNVVGDNPCYVDGTGMGDVYYEELDIEIKQIESYVFTPSSKMALISNLAMYFQKRKVTIPKSQDLLIKELKNYELKVSDTGTVRFSNNSMTAHDDTVISLALACMAHKDLGRKLDYDFFMQ